MTPQQYTKYGHTNIFASIATGAKISIQSIPSLSTWNTAIIHMIIEPLLSTFLYVSLSGMFNSGSQHNMLASTLAAVMGSCSLSTSMTVSEALAWDRFERTTPFVLTGARVGIPLWIGRISALITISLASDAITLVITLLLVDFTAFWTLNITFVLLLFIVTTLASTGFGIAIASVSMMMDDIYTIANALTAILPIIGGMIAPTSIFPQSMQHALSTLPITHITQISRAITRNATNNLGISLLVVLLIGLVWATIGILIWNIGVSIQRKKGILTNLGI